MFFAQDPVAEFKYVVLIQGIPVAQFSECGGLALEREVIPYEEGGVNDYVHHLPGRLKRANITLKRGIADVALWTWFRKGMYDGSVQRLQVTILLYKADGTPFNAWHLPDAYPIGWTGPDLKTGENQVAVETITIGQGGGAGSGESGAGGGAGIDEDDLEELAEKVYTLLEEERAASGVRPEVVIPRDIPIDQDVPQANEHEIDLQVLSTKLYQLLKQELGWEMDRLGRHRIC